MAMPMLAMAVGLSTVAMVVAPIVTVVAMVALVEAFLQQHVGGRAEPFGTAISDSSLEWRLRSLPKR